MTTPVHSTVSAPSAGTAPVPSSTGVAGVFEEHLCHRAGDLWYFDPWSQPTDSPTIYSHLVKGATKRLMIWDPYVFRPDVQVFQSLHAGISMRILTEGSSQNATEQRLKGFSADFRGQHPNVDLQVAYFNRDAYPEGLDFHDRFLFVDERVYAVGASLAAHRSRTQGTTLIEIQHRPAINLLQNRFEEYWQHEKFTRILP